LSTKVKPISKSKTKTPKSNPLCIPLDIKQSLVEDFFTKAPEKTAWTTSILNQLRGASGDNYGLDYLNRIDPVSEAQLKRIFPNATPTQMTDPLTTTTKTRLHDNVRRDASTQRGLFFLLYFVLGKEISLAFDVNRKFATQERRDKELEAIQSNEQYLDILEEIMNRDDDVDITSRLAELVFSAEAFGRSAQIKKYDRKGQPCDLIPLASTRLGRVWVDKATWKFLGVEYLDYAREQRILLAKDIIHLEVNDFNLSPNSRYFGMPSIESTMAIAERNRSANEIAVPEIMKRMFAPIMLVKTMTKSESKLQEIRDKWKAGKTLFINDEIEAEAIPIQHDLDKIMNAVLEGSKDIYRGLTVPLVVAFQDEQNRSTAETAMVQWYESTLEFKRKHINNVMWQQWYKPQLEKIFESRDMDRAASTGSVLEYLENKSKNMEDDTYEQTIPFKIKIEFANVRVTGFLDSSAALAQFHDRRLLSDDMVRTEAGLGGYNNDMQEIENERMRSGMQLRMTSPLFQQQQQMMMQGQQGPQQQGEQPLGQGQPPTTTQYNNPQNARTSNFGSRRLSLPKKSREE
jgi:hypothetical protein